MKPKPKLLAIAITTIILSAGVFLYLNPSARSASYSFFQSDWSGNASTTAVATHPGDATGYNKYYSATNVVATGTAGQISLSSTTASWAQTSDADFLTGTRFATAATSGKVVLLKPAGVACGYGAECLGGYCNGSHQCDVCESFTYSSQTYTTTLIGEQCWMAENLNVGTATTSINTGSSHSDVSNNGIIEKYCYSNSEANCTTDGGLYDWNEMMGYVTTAGVQGICAPGWHIPTDAQWYTLESRLATAACSASRSGWECAPAGTFLKTNGGTRFEALLAGNRDLTGTFNNRGSCAFFWSSSESGGNAWNRLLNSGESRVSRNTFSKTVGFSVRCLKD